MARILQLNSLLTGGGTDDQCLRLAGELRRSGQEVLIGGPAPGAMAALLSETGVPVRVLARGKSAFVRGAAKVIREEKIEIVHGHHGRDLWLTVLAARLSGIRPKIVLTRHLAKSPSSWISRRFLLGQCDAMICVSEFVARVLREGVFEPEAVEAERRARRPMLGDQAKLRVIRGGIDTGRFQPGEAPGLRREWGLAPEDFVFAVVGGYSLPRGKGQREFLAAAARIHRQVPHARFLIVGRGTMAEILKADIARLGLEGKAWLTPYCDNMPQAMNAIDCLVHPQIGTEALGLVVCEAHACGRPVIASALDGIPEAFAAGGAGVLVPAESVEKLAEAMAAVTTGPRQTGKERQQMHARVGEQFSVARMGAETLKLYEVLLA